MVVAARTTSRAAVVAALTSRIVGAASIEDNSMEGGSRPVFRDWRDPRRRAAKAPPRTPPPGVVES
jgi:hypothetical protein